jgi:hypothetical protein
MPGCAFPRVMAVVDVSWCGWSAGSPAYGPKAHWPAIDDAKTDELPQPSTAQRAFGVSQHALASYY